ncbi:hypothetical protein [Bosea sp. PAMC 26642]|uniref:hypothetical protein n=1 Tax=Bosea sp. (strain PAMC 26642) TaxID=1792307 RepID=UPI00076FF4AD|nr:hypothetical protein [Bosea sp. PAMC 26642]AMJ62459.1 hypothetical protein AXW83_21065 [Bosea sp. PAMC 26642]
MLNAHVGAAAEGMPALNRRRMLLGLAAASTTAATATVAACPTVAENPDLITLTKELPALADKYHAARKHQDATEAKWATLWPLAPDDITEPGTGSLYGNPWEKHFHGGSLTRPGEAHPRRVIPAFHFRCNADRARRVLKSKKLAAGPVDGLTRAEWEADFAESENCLALAKAYEAETTRIRDASHYDDAWKAHSAAAKALEAHLCLIMAEPDRTMEGLIMKAEALHIWDGVGHPYRLSIPGRDWHGQIAASILRHASAAA